MRVAFLGTPDFARPSLLALHESHHELALVVSQPDRPKGRGQKLQPSAVRTTARRLELDECVWERGARDAMTQRLLELELDAIVIVAFGHILRRPLLEGPRYGCINVHASLLPRWRGPAPIHRAVVAGDRVTGVSIMQLEAGVDTGPVFARREVTIENHDDTVALHDRLADIGAEALVDTLDGIEREGLSARPQVEQGVTHAPLLHKREGSARFDRSARSVHDRVRGLLPWPAVTVLWEDRPLKLLRTRVLEEESGRPGPGTVMAVEPDRLLVACADGVLAIEELQPAGKPRMNAADFARGHELEPGDLLRPREDFVEEPVRR